MYSIRLDVFHTAWLLMFLFCSQTYTWFHDCNLLVHIAGAFSEEAVKPRAEGQEIKYALVVKAGLPTAGKPEGRLESFFGQVQKVCNQLSLECHEVLGCIVAER